MTKVRCYLKAGEGGLIFGRKHRFGPKKVREKKEKPTKK